MRRMSVVVVLAALTAAGCGSTNASSTTTPAAPAASVGSTAATASSCGGSTAGTTATTKSYIFTARLGPPEKMYTQDQVSQMHPTSGEMVMSGGMQGGSTGGMAPMSGMHAEVAICDTAGKVLTNVMPTMQIADGPTGTLKPVSVMAMRGVAATTVDTHYGNNVTITQATAKLVVTLNGETATLTLHAK